MESSFKWIDVDVGNRSLNPYLNIKKLTPSRLDEIHRKIQSVLRENCNADVRRKQAGLDKQKHYWRKSKSTNTTNLVPSVCKFQSIYENNRLEMQRRSVIEANKHRNFRSRPVPSFIQKGKRSIACGPESTHSITKAITPNTLLKSMESKKKLAALRQTAEMEQMKIPKFQFNSTAYLSRPPFMPKHAVIVTEQKPFQLRSEKRAEIRKKFDAKARKNLEQRWRLHAVEDARRQYREFVALRKLTVFKARPNPWKRIS